MTIHAGVIEGRRAALIRDTDTSSSRNQCMDSFSVAIIAGAVKGRPAAAMRDIDTCSSHDQHADDVSVAIFASPEQSRPIRNITCISRRATRQKPLYSI